jgi:pyruvate formate lyase activating enzyme
MIAAGFCHDLHDKTVQCDLCHHFCLIRPGSSGICHVRKNVDGRLMTLNFGQPAARAVDPVEKKPLYHFMPGSWTYSLGTRGCNFTCSNCQNWEISQEEADETGDPSVSPETIVDSALREACPSISYTYTEPTVFAEYALAIMKLARQRGLKNIWVSNGYMAPDCLDAVEPWLDAVNIDLKSMDDRFYRQVCGARLQPVLDNLHRIAGSGIHLEITTLVIPGHSDSAEMFGRLARFVAADLGSHTPWHVIPFYPEISWKMTGLPSTSAETLSAAYLIGKKAGLSYIYAGPGHNDTLCPACGATVIERHRFNRWSNIIRLDVNGRCPSCSATAFIKD